jgi:predicted amidophosphoribosyltransferase
MGAIQCQSCGKWYDETSDSCPYCRQPKLNHHEHPAKDATLPYLQGIVSQVCRAARLGGVYHQRIGVQEARKSSSKVSPS